MQRNRKEDLQHTPSIDAHTVQKPTGTEKMATEQDTIQCCHKSPRCASKTASPTVDDVKTLNKLTRQLKSQSAKLQYCSFSGTFRVLGFPDATQRKVWSTDASLINRSHVPTGNVGGTLVCAGSTVGSLGTPAVRPCSTVIITQTASRSATRESIHAQMWLPGRVAGNPCCLTHCDKSSDVPTPLVSRIPT